VLRSWRERLLIGFSPAELTLVRMKGLPRPRVTAKHTAPCDPAFGPEPWHGAAASLKGATERLRGEAQDVTVVLSNHFVRYALVPWNDALAGAAEELGFARHCFTKIHGERSKAWTLSLSEEPAGMPRLAGAIDTALLEAIRGCFPRGGKARLVSLQPYLMAAFNCWRDSMAQAGAWLLIAEPERACLVLHNKGRWQAVLNAKGSFSAPEEWITLLDRERHRVVDGDPVNRVLVHAAHSGATRWPQVGDWRFQRLSLPPVDGYLPLADGRYTMALAAGQT
jgi:hypothetical protein